MWITYFNWFIALFSIFLWVITYIVWERERFLSWFDNKFGKDDPMPPMPKQNNPLNVGDNSEMNFKKTSTSEQKQE